MRRDREHAAGHPGRHRGDQPSAARDGGHGAHQREGDGAAAGGGRGRRVCGGRPRLAGLGAEGNGSRGKHAVPPSGGGTRTEAVPGQGGDLPSSAGLGDREDLHAGETAGGKPGGIPGTDGGRLDAGPRGTAVRGGLLPGTSERPSGAGTERPERVARAARLRSLPRHDGSDGGR